MKNFWKYFAVFLILISISFWSLLNNLDTHLIDWRDYPLYVWTISQNIDKLTSLNFINFFDTNTFFPNKMALLLSDTLLPQSIIALPFYMLSKDLIFTFNLTFVTVLILNFVSSFLFWDKIFKRGMISFLGALFIAFSPFFHLQLPHFQMLNFWPFFLSLFFLFKHNEDKKIRDLLLTGFFLAVQFLASVYLAIFLLFSIFAYYVTQVFFEVPVKRAIKSFAVIVLVFIVLDAVLIKGYLDVKNSFNVKRQYSQYVTYSAHITDYLFTTDINSVIHNSGPANFWNSFNKHVVGERASFPGFLLTYLSFFGLFILVKNRKKLGISLKLQRDDLFFFILLADGFLNSLGPRLNFNGAYVHIPTPYTLLLETFPLETIRVPSRWSYLFYLGITYFALKFLYSKRSLILGLVFILFVIEYVPINTHVSAESYIGTKDEILKEFCSDNENNTAILEFPITHNEFKNTEEGLSYVTKMLLASTHHKCNLINGYAGFDPEYLQKYNHDISGFFSRKETSRLRHYLDKLEVELLIVHKDKLPSNELANYKDTTMELEKKYSSTQVDILLIN